MSQSETPFPGRHERGSTTNRKTLCVVQQRNNNNNNNNVSHDIYNQNITYSGWDGKEPGYYSLRVRGLDIRNDSRLTRNFSLLYQIYISTFIIYEVGKASVLFFRVLSWNQSRQLLTNWWQAQKRVKTRSSTSSQVKKDSSSSSKKVVLRSITFIFHIECDGW